MSHMIFIMLPKKSLTTQLLLTNPTAVFLNDVWLLVFTGYSPEGDSAYERGGDARRLAQGCKFRILVSLKVFWAKRYHI